MSLRVGVIVGQFPSLSETFVLNQITGLLDRGADVRIIAGSAPDELPVHPAIERYGLLERTHYAAPHDPPKWLRRKRVGQLLARAAVSSSNSVAGLRKLRQHGRHDAAVALRFAHLDLPERRFDALLCHFGAHGEWGMSMRNLGLIQGRLITAFHGYDMSRYLHEEGENVYRRLFEEGDLFLPVTEYWRERLLELGCPAERTLVHRMGVRLSQFEWRARTLPGSGAVRLLSVARLTEKKGLEYAVRAVARLLPTFPRLTYEIVGAGPLRERLESLIGQLGVSEHVTLAGPLPRPDVVRRMGTAHVLLAPSVTAADGNQEGLPVVLMEALATGLPVVTTRHTGIPELVVHRSTGMVAEERDVDGLADALRQLLEDAELHGRIARQGRRAVEEDYDVERLNDRLMTLLADPPPRAGTGTLPRGIGASNERRVPAGVR